MLTVIDFETEAIQARPEYPPKPVGVAILRRGKAQYLAWGHPTGNNCTKEKARAILADIWRTDDLLFHNAKFDLDVAEAHFKLALPPWDRVHDTLYTLFLTDPHALSLGLKPSAERYLKMPPEERDAVKEWLVAHRVIAANQSPGAYIAKCDGKVVGKYAIGDVDRTLKLHKLLHPQIVEKGMQAAYDRERKLMPILLDNERQGMRFDVDAAEEDIPIYEKAMEQAEAWLRKRLKVKEINFDADAEVGEALARAKIVTDFVLTKTGKRSVAKKNMGLDKFKDPQVFQILGYRNRLQTVLSLNLRPWLAMAQANGGMIYTEWNQVRNHAGEKVGDSRGTRTGRLSCSRFQNISKDFTDKGDGYSHPTKITVPELPLVRRYLLPDEGHVFCHRDYNQQEFRIVAHFAEGDIEAEYKAKPETDYHTLMQQRINSTFNIELARRPTKILNFGIMYGMGSALLAVQLGVTVEEARKLINMVKKAAPDIARLDAWCKEKGHDGEPIRTWGGRLYYCEQPKYVEKYKRLMTFEYKLLNYLIQGSAADCTKEAIIRYHDIRRDGRMLVTVHDEINLSVPRGAHLAESERLREAMQSIEFDVPMLTDAKYGLSWGSLVGEAKFTGQENDKKGSREVLPDYGKGFGS